MYKIHNFQPFVPNTALYVRVIKEHGDTYSVDYWRDEEGRNPVMTYGFSGLILTGQELSEMTDGDFSVSDSQNRDYGTNYVVIEVDPKRDYMEIGDPFRIVEVEHEYRVGDIFRTVANDATQRVLVWVKVLKVINDSEVYYTNPHVREASEPMKKLKDTTKVAGQNKQKLRNGDKGGKGKENDPNSSGEDVRGIGKFPHSKGEKEFADKHKVDIVDHPANQKDWGIETVTNKDIGNKFENFAPLSSEGFQLNEFVANAASMNSLDNYIYKQYENQVDRIADGVVDYDPYKKKKDVVVHIKSLYPFQRDASQKTQGVLKYFFPGDLGSAINLRGWLTGVFNDSKLKEGVYDKNNKHIYEIVQHLKSSGYNLSHNTGQTQYLGGAGENVKIYTHNYIDKLDDDDDVAAIQFKLLANSQQFSNTGDYNLEIKLFSKQYHENAQN